MNDASMNGDASMNDEIPSVAGLRPYIRDGWVVLELAGEHDLSTTPTVEAAILSATHGRDRAVFDLTGLTYLDSTVLTMLVRSHKRLGKGLRVVVPASSRVRRIFEITKLDRLFAIDETLDDALGRT